MYTLKEEFIVLIYLIMYGIYLFSSLDIITIISDKVKKNINKIFIQVLYWLFQIYITFIFSYQLMNGYVPIYFILFIYVGYYIYEKTFKKYFKKIIKIFFYVLKKILKFIIKIVKPLIYSKQLLKFIKKVLTHEKRIIKKTFKKKETENTNTQDDIIIETNNSDINN